MLRVRDGAALILLTALCVACGADVLVPWGSDDPQPACHDRCAAEGEEVCALGTVSTCVVGAKGCLELGSPVACATGACRDDASCDPCLHECSEVGSSCRPGGNVESCSRGSDGCRVLRTTECMETCIAGKCGQFALLQVASGGYFTCQLAAPVLNTGAVQCWGNDAVGDGSLDGAYTPREVDNLDAGVIAVSAGDRHACAVLNTGAVRCWGKQRNGELGDGTYDIERSRPVEVKNLGGIATDVSCGKSHTCALLAGGDVRCWGSDSQGQLGDGGLDEDQSVPGPVVDLPGPARQVSAGGQHTCAVLETGAAYCWGDGLGGRLGTGDQIGRSVPTPVFELSSGVEFIAAGGWHSCALLQTGAVKCWGNDSRGSVGDGEPRLGAVVKPMDVLNLEGGVDLISAGHAHTCALMLDGRIKCWGDDFHYQLGDDDPRDTIHQSAPVDVIWASGSIGSISAGRHHTCVLFLSGAIGCWGKINGSSGGADPVCFACLDE